MTTNGRATDVAPQAEGRPLRDRIAKSLGGVVPIVALTVAALVLGYWGVSRLPGELSASDTLYITIQLFYANLGAPEGGTPWQLDVARFLAPAAVAYALLLAVLAATRDRVQRLRVRFFRGHVVVIGVGMRGTALARSLRRTRRVIGLELDPTNGAAQSLRKTGLPVLIGDARDGEVLRDAGAGRAGHVVVVADDDSTNLEVLAALRRVVSPDRPVPMHIAIDAPALWSELHRWPLQSAKAQRRVEFVSIPDRIAQLLVAAAVDEGTVSAAQRRLLISGLGPTVARLVVHLLRSPMTGEGIEILLQGGDSAENLEILGGTDPWVFERARIGAAEPGRRSDAFDVAFVCGLPEAEALDEAVVLASAADDHATVHVAVPDSGIRNALARIGIELARLELVPTEELLGEQLLEGAAFERIARGKHADYLVHELARGKTPEEKPALVPWNQLDEKYRRANLRFADGVQQVLARLDAELIPLTGRRVGELPISPEVLEELAIAEHDRWWQDKIRDGETGHPSMVPWEELSEDDKNRDREGIRALPRLFASVGYELVVPNSGTRTPAK